MAAAEYRFDMKVRDYECDMQGIVNNAIYQHYLEHARHEFLLENGLDFAELTAAGVILVVVRAELDYLQSLHSGEEFTVTVKPVRESRVRICFEQEIVRKRDANAILRARIIVTALNERQRPHFPEQLERLLD